MKKIKDINDFNFINKIALVRVDFNVPIDNNGNITDDTRIKYSIPTIKKIINDGGKVVLISHFGRPKGISNKKYSINFLVPILSKILKRSVQFCKNCIGKSVKEKIDKLNNGDILLLENLRFHKSEEKEDDKFAFELSKFTNIYVNDAFGVSHRNHSSIITVPKFFFDKKCIGLLMKKEIQNLDRFLSKNSKKPITIVLGGAKISSKINVVEKFIDFANYIIIGGKMSYPFISIINNENKEKYDIKLKKSIKNILYKNEKKNTIILPTDIVSSKNINDIKITSINNVPKGYTKLDIGPNSIINFCKIIEKSNTILWNGPMGKFEISKFSKGTMSIAKKISEVTVNKKAYSMIGGGDSIFALKQQKCIDKISYISTGGGAMLAYLKNKTLPGIKIIYS